jgi:thiol-disulfide isomerase/thioredoxin
LRAGDIVLGPPDAPFTEPHAIREWTMRREIGEAAPLQVLREDRVIQVSLVPAAFPVKMPELPGPPPVGADAPELKLSKLRGGEIVGNAKSKLLFFWATWCVPCKFSLPEVLAFGKQRGVEVVAITDEDPQVLEDYFAKTKEPFADRVAIDPLRITFREYGVSGTPTFVLVDEHDVVRHYQTGYKSGVGLGIDGWKWSGAPPAKASEKTATR